MILKCCWNSFELVICKWWLNYNSYSRIEPMKGNIKKCRWNPPISLAAAKHFHLLLLALCLIFHQTSAIKSFTHLRSLKCFRSTLIIRFLDWFLNILTSSFHFIWAIYRLWMGIDPFHLFKFWAVGCTEKERTEGKTNSFSKEPALIRKSPQ